MRRRLRFSMGPRVVSLCFLPLEWSAYIIPRLYQRSVSNQDAGVSFTFSLALKRTQLWWWAGGRECAGPLGLSHFGVLARQFSTTRLLRLSQFKLTEQNHTSCFLASALAGLPSDVPPFLHLSNTFHELERKTTAFQICSFSPWLTLAPSDAVDPRMEAELCLVYALQKNWLHSELPAQPCRLHSFSGDVKELSLTSGEVGF
jgi:hypothetical protein